MSIINYIGYFFAVVQGVQSAQWSSTSPKDGFVIYGCVNDVVSIPWEYVLGPGDSLDEITWQYDGHSQEMIAIFSHGHIIPMPAFSNRLSAVSNAGISVRDMLVGDSGNYSVEVRVFQDSGSHIIMIRSVFIHISDQLLTTDGILHATLRSEAVLDLSTDRWSIQINCGEFLFVDNPPIFVEWITPSGQVVNSTGFIDHHFYLLLLNPVQGGNYTCRIPPHNAQDVCLRDNTGHAREASVFVDKVDAGFLVLEKENKILKEQLLAVTTNYQGRLNKLEEAARSQVAFQARYLLSGIPPPSGTPLIFSEVIYNQGEAYNSTAGYFTAPFSGVYFFISTIGFIQSNTTGYHDLYVDDVLVAQAYTHSTTTWEMAPVHAVVHVNKGQRVCIRGDGVTYYSTFSMFSGFLLSQDV